MYEIAPYATFSVSCGRTTSELSKTPLRGVTPSALDYTVQFKTFGHPDGDNLNATAYPVLPSAGFGHVKGKSSWQNQRYYNTDGNCIPLHRPTSAYFLLLFPNNYKQRAFKSFVLNCRKL